MSGRKGDERRDMQRGRGVEVRGDASVRLFSRSFAHVCRYFTPEYPLANSKSYLRSLLFKVRKGVKNLQVFFFVWSGPTFFLFSIYVPRCLIGPMWWAGVTKGRIVWTKTAGRCGYSIWFRIWLEKPELKMGR